MVHKKEKLSQKEGWVQEKFLASLKVAKRKTKKPIVVATVGLVGSGKSSVAKELANLIGATIIEGDAIRVELRKQKERYENTRKIAEDVAIEIIKQSGNVILDSDHIDQKKRASLREKVKGTGARLIFIRIHCDMDVVVGRVLSANYLNRPEDFFGDASSKWLGSENKGAVVKIREMWRRTPHHYRWVNQVGGKWMLKKLPFTIFADINTTDSSWKTEIQKLAEKLSTL